MFRALRQFLQRLGQRRQLDAIPPRPFVDTPEAWDARRVIPGETSAEARKRLAKYRRLDG